MHSILVIRLSSLGDIILTTPLVRQLQRTYPNARIDVAVAERFADVWKNNPRVANVWSIETGVSVNPGADDVKIAMMESVAGEVAGGYDLIVDLQNNLRSSSLARGLGSNVVRVPKHRLEKLALVWLKKSPKFTVPIVARYRKPLENLPLVLDVEGGEVWLPEERTQGVYLSAQPPLAASRRIALAPGAHHETKRWPIAKFAEAARDLTLTHGFEVVLVGGSADVEICNAVANASGVEVVRADGATSIEATTRTLDSCLAIITNDSGVMHLAAARRLPIVAIFGSTVRELGFAPYAVSFHIVEHDVACRPCSHIGRSSCPKGHFNCMNLISPSQVIHSLTTLI